jgi:hypothetical protein
VLSSDETKAFRRVDWQLDQKGKKVKKLELTTGDDDDAIVLVSITAPTYRDATKGAKFVTLAERLCKMMILRYDFPVARVREIPASFTFS